MLYSLLNQFIVKWTLELIVNYILVMLKNEPIIVFIVESIIVELKIIVFIVKG